MKAILLAAAVVLLSCTPSQGQSRYTASAILNPRVQKDLKLTAKQSRELKKVIEAHREAVAKKLEEGVKNPQYTYDPVTNGPSLSVQVDDEAAKLQTDLTKLLTKSQLRRLDEFWVQSRGTRALLDPEIAERLNLDEATFVTIKELFAERDQETKKLLSNFYRANQDGILNTGEKQQRANKTLHAKTEEVKKKYETEILRLLTKKQRATFLALHGEPLKPDDPETAQGEPAKAEASKAPAAATDVKK